MSGPVLRALTLGASVLAVAHAANWWWRRHRTRAADAVRLPVGPDGVIPGAEGFWLRGSSTHAALLLHGFGDTPQTLRRLARCLHAEHGWTVHVPLLPGHGRTLAAFDASGSAAWRAAVHDAYVALKAQFPTVAVVGLSMGGALATIEAAADPELPALVLLAPYLTPPASAERLAPLAGVINLIWPYLAGGDRERSILDPVARADALGYGAAPPRRVRDLVAVAHDARLAAGAVQAPTLLVHSRTDYRIPVPLAEAHPTFFTAARTVAHEWVEGSGHVITVDFCRDRVWALTAEWLARFAGAPQAARADVS